jgi:tetratricopeptide (TPR) repeat protein
MACAARTSGGLADRFVTRGESTAGAEATFDVGPVADGALGAAEPAGRPVPVEPVPKFVAPNALEDVDPALGEAMLAAAADPSAETHRRLAAEYRRLKVFDRAEKHLALALALEPRDASLFVERARVWREMGVLDRALSDAHRAAYLAPDSAEAQNTLGTVLFALGRVTEAGQRFARAATIEPGAAHLLSNLCYARYADGDLAAALEACDAALRLDPALAVAQQNRGLVTAAMTGQDHGTEGTP